MTVYKDWMDAGIEIPHGKSGEFDIRCPKCSDSRSTPEHRRHKCLGINTDKGTWLCQHCGWKGGIAKRDWRAEVGLPKVYAKPEPVEDPVLTKRAIDWFASRGIGQAVLARNRVYSGRYAGQEAVCYPLTMHGEICMVKYRYGKKQHGVTADARAVPWGFDDCKDADVVVVVEGEPDKLVIEQVTGIEAVLSPPNGSNVSDDVAELMTKACANASKVLLAGDMDEPGQKMLAELARRIGYDRCWMVKWPEKDANDTLLAHGEEAVRECLDGARQWPIEGVRSIRDLRDLTLDLYERGMPAGYSTGCQVLDEFWRVALGELSVWTGVPNSGKTRMIDWVSYGLTGQGVRAGMCSMETAPLQRHVSRMAQLVTGKAFRDGPTQRMTRDELLWALDVLEERYWFIAPESPSPDAVLEAAKQLIERYGLEFIVIDPWNRMEHYRPGSMAETEYITMVLAKLQRFAQNHSCHVALVAHPRKMPTDSGEYEVVKPYDIAGSAGFFNVADSCLSVWRSREDMSKPVELHIQKIRNEENGQLGKVSFSYDMATGRYTAIPKALPTYGKPVAMPRYDVGKVETFPGLELYGD